ncbi:hypothetical protein CCR75_008281 [Bremia lactucae]|uniref:Uncharacterized protein n=1 Tax=Bremia lactucae TaxID=4779 RepID=A0A976II97_BRELC|nr:hypothetical protein CCR75_008281 [Bremia lactucae]
MFLSWDPAAASAYGVLSVVSPVDILLHATDWPHSQENLFELFKMEESTLARPRRGVSRATRSAVKPSKGGISDVLNTGGSSADEEDEDEEEEEEEEIEEEDDESVHGVDESELDVIDAGFRTSPTARELHTLEKGTLVRILKTPDVDQRVPHTAFKMGVVDEVPQHPNTWFKVRILDGDVVYKYRPSALEVLDEGDDSGSPGASPPYSLIAHQDEYSHYDDAEADKDEESKEKRVIDHHELGNRVKLKLGALNAAEKRYLKNYDGREGTITGRWKAGVTVQLDGSKDIKLKLRQKHLVLLLNTRHAEDEEEKDEETKEGKKAAVILKKRRGKGKLLSTLDPDMWIERKCRINVGKFKGQHGRVLRSGNGWVQLRLENSSENTAKRAYELTLLEDLQTIKMLHVKTLEKENKRRGENGVTVVGDDREDEEDDDEANQSGADELQAAEHTDDSQGEDNGKRLCRVSTRGNYGMSWIGKKVNLPNRKGFGIVKKADRETCTVEIQTTQVLQIYKKKDLQLASDVYAKTARQNSRNRNNAKAREKLGLEDDVILMGTTPSRYIAFQDLVKRFAMRRREKLKKRPNLIEWEARLNLNYLENGSSDKNNLSVVDLVLVPQCEICGLEKEEKDGNCWNNKCPRSPAFDVDSYDPKSEDAFMRVPDVPFFNNNMTISLCLDKEDSSRKRKLGSLHTTPTEICQPNLVMNPFSTTKPEPKAEDTQTKNSRIYVYKNNVGAMLGHTSTDENDLDNTSNAIANNARAQMGSIEEVTNGLNGGAMSEEMLSTSAFRPHYDSVFSR